MISKELLSEVLNVNVDNQRGGYSLIDNYLYYGTSGGNSHRINIYELAHKCKSCALDNGYYISSIATENVCSASVYSDVDGIIEVYSIASRTEPSAIFKACEWIIENKE